MSFYLSITIFVVAVSMCVAFAIAWRLQFFSLIDVFWTFTFSFIALAFGLSQKTSAAQWIFYAMVLVWSLRLGFHILVRLISHFPNEDARYVELRKKWAGSFGIKFGAFFAVQGISIIFLSIPLILVAVDYDLEFGVMQRIALGLWLIGVIGEALSDFQLRTFKKKSENAGQVCEVGFWRYSRHPNYFCEWLIWCAIGLFALNAPFGFVGLVAPATMYYLLNYVSGVPLAEAQSVKSKGSLYIDYQHRVNRFFPGRPKTRLTLR